MWIIPLIILIFVYVFLKSPFGKGLVGEYIVRFIIGKTKENEQYVINDYMLLVEGKSSQIDHIVINRKGIFVIETKNYSGRIYGDESHYEWTQTLNYGRVKHKLYNPIKQNATHIRRLKELLPEGIPIKSVIVFVQGNTQYLQTDKVIGLNRLKSVIDYPSEVVLSVEQVKDIYDKLIKAKEFCTVTSAEHIREINTLKDNINKNICPRCGASLIVKHGKHGDFLGCPSYPKCKYSKHIK